MASQESNVPDAGKGLYCFLFAGLGTIGCGVDASVAAGLVGAAGAASSHRAMLGRPRKACNMADQSGMVVFGFVVTFLNNSDTSGRMHSPR